jgi:hypothetical protein
MATSLDMQPFWLSPGDVESEIEGREVEVALMGNGVSGPGVEGGFMRRPPQRLQAVAPVGLWLMPVGVVTRVVPSLPNRRG